MIPQEHIAAATRALKEAFGVTRFDDVRDLTEAPTRVGRCADHGAPTSEWRNRQTR